MNTRDRNILRPHVEPHLPTEFEIEQYDDFVNYRPFGQGAERVVRIIGRGRHLMLFRNEARGTWQRPEHQTFYLRADNEIVEFHPRWIERDWRQANGKGLYDPMPWDKVISQWLVEHDAMAFKGRGWAEPCAAKILELVNRWQQDAKEDA